jgi:hypothetical protein
MYSLDHAQLTFLLNAEVIQICMGQHQIQLHCTNDIQISWENSFEHVTETGVHIFPRHSLINDTQLERLVSHKIVKVEKLPGDSLKLVFEHGDELLLRGDDSEYECYTLSSKEGVIVV